jgi:hypothetical protein
VVQQLVLWTLSQWLPPCHPNDLAFNSTQKWLNSDLKFKKAAVADKAAEADKAADDQAPAA